MSFGRLVDLELDDEDQLDYPMPMPMDRPKYPCGLIINLDEKALEKLGLGKDCDVGDYLDLRAFATVISKREDESSCCVTLQIEKMAVESETDED